MEKNDEKFPFAIMLNVPFTKQGERATKWHEGWWMGRVGGKVC